MAPHATDANQQPLNHARGQYPNRFACPTAHIRKTDETQWASTHFEVTTELTTVQPSLMRFFKRPKLTEGKLGCKWRGAARQRWVCVMQPTNKEHPPPALERHMGSERSAREFVGATGASGPCGSASIVRVRLLYVQGHKCCRVRALGGRLHGSGRQLPPPPPNGPLAKGPWGGRGGPGRGDGQGILGGFAGGGGGIGHL